MNTRILIIDDEEIVRDDIEEILTPKKSFNLDVSTAAGLLFDSDEEVLISPPPQPVTYVCHFEGVQRPGRR